MGKIHHTKKGAEHRPFDTGGNWKISSSREAERTTTGEKLGGEKH